MTKKKLLFVAAIVLLICANVATVLYYNYTISTMRQQSSFKEISSELTFKKCLDSHRIENKLIDSRYTVREVDTNKALSNCA